MSPMGSIHFIFSLVAIVAGAAVLGLSKGTRWHRTLGHAYVWAMVGVVGTSFAMFNMTGRFTPFHFAALVAGVTIIGGMWTVLGRRPKGQWIEAHGTWMAWSYVGLMGAFVAESLTRFVMPALRETLEANALLPAFWTLVAVGSFFAVGVGARLIRRRLPAAVAATPQAMRKERSDLRALEEAAG